MRCFENDCVGCPQGCIDCGRKRVLYIYCDECGDNVEYDEVREEDNNDYCPKCHRKLFPEEYEEEEE